jgi:hypothetical protein
MNGGGIATDQPLSARLFNGRSAQLMRGDDGTEPALLTDNKFRMNVYRLYGLESIRPDFREGR